MTSSAARRPPTDPRLANSSFMLLNRLDPAPGSAAYVQPRWCRLCRQSDFPRNTNSRTPKIKRTKKQTDTWLDAEPIGI